MEKEWEIREREKEEKVDYLNKKRASLHAQEIDFNDIRTTLFLYLVFLSLLLDYK